jgi:hypothetical protein
MHDLGSNQGRCGGKAANERLGYSMAYIFTSVQFIQNLYETDIGIHWPGSLVILLASNWMRAVEATEQLSASELCTFVH